MIRLFSPQGIVGFSAFTFPGGERHVRLDSICKDKNSFFISATLNSSDSIMDLLLLTNALRRNYLPVDGESLRIELHINYLAYARQDRVCVEGESLSLEVMASIINSQKYDLVTVSDPHSDVASALISACQVIPQSEFITQLVSREIIKPENTVVVIPDAGAAKKSYALASLNFLGFVQALKYRDLKTGDITGTQVSRDDFNGKDILIADDICDGGRTFTELAKVLRNKNCGKITLFVTHGIFSKGLGPFSGLIDKVICAHKVLDEEFPAPQDVEFYNMDE